MTPTILIVPGLRDEMPEHWQSILQRKIRGSRVVPRIQRECADWISCAAWIELLDRTLASIEGPVVLVAHSAGVAIVVHWAQRHHRLIHGALLATPPDFEAAMPAGYPTLDVLRSSGWLPMPRASLPFPSIVAGSTNDPLGSLDRVADLASAWGSRFVNVGGVGHLNPASGYGEWRQAETFVGELSQRVVA